MRYLKRLIIYIILFFLTYSVGTTLLFRFIPVTVTPLKVVRLFENLREEGLSVHSNWVSLKKINPTMPITKSTIPITHKAVLSVPCVLEATTEQTAPPIARTVDPHVKIR